MAISVGSSSFPQKGNNRTRSEFIQELADHSGGGDRPEVQRRAGACIDAAVREFNSVHWRFNRVINNITLATNTADYTLATDFDSPIDALLVDSNGDTRLEVTWIPYEHWIEIFPGQTHSGSVPTFYTARNVHETGIVTVDPQIGSTIAYPTLRIHYFRRIALAKGNNDFINAPLEVEEAIFQLSLAKFMHKNRGASEAITEYRLASAMRLEVERKHRDFGRRH